MYELKRRSNGKGTAIFLGKNRQNPWGARITIGRDSKGNLIFHYIDFFKTELEALVCLENYHKEPYPIYIKEQKYKRIATFPRIPYPLVSVEDPHNEVVEKVKKDTYTFKQLWDEFEKMKIPTKAEQRYCKNNHVKLKGKYSFHYARGMITSFHACKPLYDKVYKDLKTSDFQNFLNTCNKSYDSLRLILNLFVKLDEYAFSMPLGSTARPDVRFEKAIPEQTIEFIDAPLGSTTQIIVTAENGDKKTYSLTFPIVEPEGDNVLEIIYYSYIDAFDIEHKGVLDNPTSEGDINIQLPYRVKSFSVDSVKKTYAEQSVYVNQGGIYAATELSVIANKSEQTDKTYRLVPVIEQQNPAVLDGISVNGTPIADFDKNRFVYVVNVSTSPIVTTTGYNGTFPNIVEASTKHWEAVVSKDGFSNTYEIWYYYPSNVIPNSDFTNWTTAKNNSAAKPENWQVLADYFDKFDAFASGAHTFGKNGEVEQTTISGSNKAVHLNSKQSAGNFI